MIILQISKNSFVYEILSRSVGKIEYCAPKIETPEMRIFFFILIFRLFILVKHHVSKIKPKLSQNIYIYIFIYLFPIKFPI